MNDAEPPKIHATRSNSNTPTSPQLTPPIISRISASLSHMQLHLFSAISVRIHIRFSQFCSYSMPANRVEYSVENTRFLTVCILCGIAFDNNHKWRTILFVQFYKIHREQAFFVYFPLTGDGELCIIDTVIKPQRWRSYDW